jgi:hypothetical protein
MASSSSSRSEGIDKMEAEDVPPALRERLGTEGTAGLIALFEIARQEWTDDVISSAVERIEHRIAEEGATARVNLGYVEATLKTEIGQSEARLRTEIGLTEAKLRTEIGALGASLRVEMADQKSALCAERSELQSALRGEMAALGTDLRRDMSDLRFSVIKWNFVFWTGQLLVTAALLGLFLQALR